MVLAEEQRPIFADPPTNAPPLEIECHPCRLPARLPVEIEELRLGRIKTERLVYRRRKKDPEITLPL